MIGTDSLYAAPEALYFACLLQLCQNVAEATAPFSHILCFTALVHPCTTKSQTHCGSGCIAVRRLHGYS
jgi:hypothetical protein